MLWSKRRYMVGRDHNFPALFSAYRRIGPFWFYVHDTLSSTREGAIERLSAQRWWHRVKPPSPIYFDKEGNVL